MNDSQEIIKYIPHLKRYVKSKVKTVYWEDVVQETLLYLLLKIDNIEITNTKGLLFNTANFFISKSRNNRETVPLNNNDKITNFNGSVIKNKYNTYILDDKIFCKLLKVDKKHLKKFVLQINGYSIKEISVMCNCNENTVKTHIKRCKDYLKH